MGKGQFIWASRPKCVIDVCQSNHMDIRRDLAAEQTIRVPFAVPPLVVVAANIIKQVKHRTLTQTGDALQQFAAFHGVGLHLRILLRRQLPGFIQNGGGDHLLADVVEHGQMRDQ